MLPSAKTSLVSYDWDVLEGFRFLARATVTHENEGSSQGLSFFAFLR